MEFENDGKCGICGDNYADASPREHEAGGRYATGTIVRNYVQVIHKVQQDAPPLAFPTYIFEVSKYSSKNWDGPIPVWIKKYWHIPILSASKLSVLATRQRCRYCNYSRPTLSEKH